MTPTISQTLANLDAYLPRTPLISASETARLLGYPSTGALAKARQMGRLPIVMFKVPGRRGWFAATQTVKTWLESLLLPSAESVDEHERHA
jgi:hypothetical protein